MTPEQKKFIDEASYESLLYRWRFAPVGSPWFIGEVGEYYAKIMAEKKEADPDDAIRASKSIGWQG